MSNISESKAECRKRLRPLRRALTPRARRAAAQAIARRGQRFLAFGKRCGLYFPAKGEADVLPMLHRGLAKGACCFLPVVPPAWQRKLWFTAWQADGHWTPNRYGIPEQSHRSHTRIRAMRLDVLFLPLLGFDDAGNRMGMGGGYYDATLAYLRHRKRWRRPLLVGVAFECQRVSVLPADPWDVPMDAVITERRVRRWRPRPVH